MMPSDILSVSLFKKSVAEYLPDYISMDNEVVFKTIQSALDNNNQIYDSAKILSQELEQNQINLKEVLDNFLTDLADYYVQSPNHEDPIIDKLLQLGHSGFLSKIEDAKELQIAIQRSERKRIKELLIAYEEQQEEEDIPAAFQRIERKEKKKQLQELEETEDLMPTGSSFAAYSQIEELNDEYQFNKSAKSKNQIRWKFVIRVAAILILVLIPFGITILFFEGSSNQVLHSENTNKTKKKSSNSKSKTEDKTHDNESESSSIKIKENPKSSKSNSNVNSAKFNFEELYEINIPNAVFYSFSTSLNERNLAYAQREEKISINLISFKNQIAYLDNKIQSIESKYDELISKKIKNKKSTLQSLMDVKEKCSLKKIELLVLEATYEYKNGKLKLFKQEKIDLKSIKVYSLCGSVDNKIFYLKIGEDYFDLSKSKGKLKKVVDPDIIEQLDDI